jgi:hypothetical protein
MSEPKFTGVWIPAGVFQTSKVSITAKVVYGVVEALDNDDGCFASNAYLSRHLGLGERQIRNILQELDEANLITRVEVDGRRVIRTVEKTAVVKALGEEVNCLGGRKNIATGGGKKLPTYNKEDNKSDKDTVKQQIWIARLPFGSEAFLTAWKSWVAYRKEMKKTLTDSSVQAQCKEFVLWGEAKSIASIEQSIKQGWQGLFEPKQVFGKGNTNVLTARDHEAF